MDLLFRLGSLDDSISDVERPDFGFLHKIRSPEHRPVPLLDDSSSDSYVQYLDTSSSDGSNRNTYTVTPQREEGGSPGKDTENSCLSSAGKTEEKLSLTRVVEEGGVGLGLDHIGQQHGKIFVAYILSVICFAQGTIF